MSINFNNPYLLLIFIPLIIIFTIPFIIKLVKKQMNKKGIFSYGLHLVIALLLTLSCAGTTYHKVISETAIYVLADISYSSNEKLEQIDDYIAQINDKFASDSKISIICFGKDAQTLTPLGGKIKSVTTSNVDTSATNIENALDYTFNNLDENYLSRIILISDGKETDGDGLTYAEKMLVNNENLRLDILSLDTSLDDDTKEIQINSINYPKSIYYLKENTLKASIQTNYAAKVDVALYENNELLERKQVNMVAGINIVNFSLDTSNIGNNNYSLRIENAADYDERNNRYDFVQEVVSSLDVLAITSKEDYSSIKKLIGEYSSLTIYRCDQSFSTRLEYLTSFDEIVLANVDLTQVNNYQTLITNIETCVTKYGKSLITIGGETSYQNGGYYMTNIDQMLPVNMRGDKKSIALTLVIDNSGSMGYYSSRLDKAKEGAIQCVSLLDEDDYVSVITFSDTTKVVVPLTKAKNKESIINKINGITYGDGTMMTPALTSAYNQLKNLSFENRQVLLISDGEPWDDGQVEVVKKMTQNGIVTSVINIDSSEGKSLMLNIATTGNGSYYYVKDSDDLANVMIASVTDSTSYNIIEKTSSVAIDIAYDPVLSNISNVDDIEGFNFSAKKFNATTVLSSSFTDENDVIHEVPIYAYWSYGNGKVSSLMCDITGSWSASWTSEMKSTLMENILLTNVPEERISTSFDVEVETKGYTTEISVEVPNSLYSSEVRLVLTSPTGEITTQKASLLQGVYYSEFETPTDGVYSLKIEFINGISYYSTTDNFTFAYSSEYNYFSNDGEYYLELLSNHGTLTDDVKKLKNNDSEASVLEKSFVLPFIIAALVLFFIDLAMRMIKLSDIKKLFKK